LVSYYPSLPAGSEPVGYLIGLFSWWQSSSLPKRLQIIFGLYLVKPWQTFLVSDILYLVAGPKRQWLRKPRKRMQEDFQKQL
jgi:hypothetical protein